MGVEYEIVPEESGFLVEFEVDGRPIGTLPGQFSSVQASLTAILNSPRPEFRSAKRKVSREALRLWADNVPQIKRLYLWRRNAAPDELHLAVELYSHDSLLLNEMAETWKQQVSSRINRRVTDMKLSREVKNPADQLQEVYYRHARD